MQWDKKWEKRTRNKQNIFKKEYVQKIFMNEYVYITSCKYHFALFWFITIIYNNHCDFLSTFFYQIWTLANCNFIVSKKEKKEKEI